MTSIFLSAGLPRIEETDLIEDWNQEYQNIKYSMAKKIILLVEDSPDDELLTTYTQKKLYYEQGGDCDGWFEVHCRYGVEHLIIGCIDKQEIKVGAEKIKELEIKLRKMFEINEKLQAKKKPWQAKSDIDDVIRRRKGEPDKRISRMPKKI
jgi:hypothetical protein